MTATTLQRLLKYPHAAVFDKDPLAELVIRVRHQDGCTWRVAAGVLVVTAGAAEFTYQLLDYTVGSLANRLGADGFDVLLVTAAYNQFSALALVEGSNDQWLSNGDHLRVFTSLMWALFQGYARELDAAQAQVRQALLQMVIKTAEGDWLDLWGTLYGVPRLTGETDSHYRLRIPIEAFRLRVNPRAMELAIKELTGKDVIIREPWEDVFTLDQSVLSGSDRLQDGEMLGPFLIQPVSRTPIQWDDVLPVIERSRPAGVLMLPPQSFYGGGVVVPNDSTVGTSIKRRHVATVLNEDVALLDNAMIEDVSVPNYPFLHRRRVLHRNGAIMGTVTWPNHQWQNSPWNEIKYLVSTRSWRSYRVLRLQGVEYVSQPWAGLPWNGLQWTTSTLIGTRHTRSS